MEQINKKSSFWALSPLIVFVALFIGTGIITSDFNFLPINVALLISTVFAFIIYPKTNLTKKIDNEKVHFKFVTHFSFLSSNSCNSCIRYHR